MYRLINGEQVELTQEERDEWLAQSNSPEVIAAAQKSEKRSLYPDNDEVISTVVSQLLYMYKNTDIDFIDDFKDMALQIKNANDSYPDITTEKDIKPLQVSEKNEDKIKIKIDELEAMILAVKEIAEDATMQQKATEELLSEIQSALQAIRGFMMMLPDINTNLNYVKEKIDNSGGGITINTDVFK